MDGLLMLGGGLDGDIHDEVRGVLVVGPLDRNQSEKILLWLEVAPARLFFPLNPTAEDIDEMAHFAWSSGRRVLIAPVSSEAEALAAQRAFASVQ